MQTAPPIATVSGAPIKPASEPASREPSGAKPMNIIE